MLKEKIKILEDEKLISNEVANYTNSIIDFLERYHFEELKLDMFITHFAMATQRSILNQDEYTIDEVIWSQVLKDKNFIKANKLLYKIIKEAPCQYLENEKKFLVLHLCNLLAI